MPRENGRSLRGSGVGLCDGKVVGGMSASCCCCAALLLCRDVHGMRAVYKLFSNPQNLGRKELFPFQGGNVTAPAIKQGLGGSASLPTDKPHPWCPL